MATNAAAVSTTAIEELRATIGGDVIVGADGGRTPFNAMHPSHADVAVLPGSTTDVVAAVRFARAHGLPITVRGGGHSIAGLSAADGGLLIDLARMDGVHVDPERKLAYVQGGALLGDMDRETQAFGLAAPTGVVSNTGVAGLTLGGGYGWLRRKHGLACDGLVEAQVVDAEGNVRVASEEHGDADLLWALRGGGGNFGIVTSFTFRLVELGPEVAFSATMYPLEDVAGLLRGWRDFVTGAPDDITSVCVSITFPPDPHLPEVVHNRPVLIVGGVHATASPQEGLAAMAPLRELGTPVFDMSAPTPWIVVQSGFDALFERGAMQAYWKAGYMTELSDAAIDALAARALSRPAPLTLVNAFHMGGAIAKVDPEATAFAAREAEFLFSIDGVWDDPADNEANVAWVRDAFAELGEFGTGEVYLNFTGDAGDLPSVDTAHGRNAARLRALKAKYDPQNVFARNNNIPPA